MPLLRFMREIEVVRFAFPKEKEDGPNTMKPQARWMLTEKFKKVWEIVFPV